MIPRVSTFKYLKEHYKKNWLKASTLVGDRPTDLSRSPLSDDRPTIAAYQKIVQTSESTENSIMDKATSAHCGRKVGRGRATHLFFLFLLFIFFIFIFQSINTPHFRSFSHNSHTTSLSLTHSLTHSSKMFPTRIQIGLWNG